MTLAEWMKAEDKTMDFVAKALGTTRQSVHTWVSGRNAPRIYYALAIQVLSEGKVPVESWLTHTQAMAVAGFKSQVAAGGPQQEQRSGVDMERNGAVA